jgi:hypothetical protein
MSANITNVIITINNVKYNLNLTNSGFYKLSKNRTELVKKVKSKEYFYDIDFDAFICELDGFLMFWSKNSMFKFYVIPSQNADINTPDSKLYEKLRINSDCYTTSEFNRIVTAITRF